MKDIKSYRTGLPTVFVTYMTVWNKLHAEYEMTPDWRFIRKQRLLNDMHRLTKKYVRWFDGYTNCEIPPVDKSSN
jgi:hypothetical protein